MNFTSKQLRLLDPETFHELCFVLLKSRHPDLGVRKVEGKGGDKGVDLFCGSLNGRPIIWQVKFFPDGIKKSQRQQIKKSLVSALTHFQPSHWILCVPVALDIVTWEWIEKLRKDYQSTVRIEVQTGTEIALELIHFRSIRETFFPATSFDPALVRELMSRSGRYSLDELQKITEQNVSQYLDNLKAKDGRFSFHYRFVEDNIEPLYSVPSLATINQGNVKIDVFPRDLEALRSDPVRVRMKLKGLSAATKLTRVIDYGFSESFTSDEISEVSTSLDHLFPLPPEPKVTIGPSAPQRRVAMKMRFTSESRDVSYDLFYFRCLRAGRKEAEFVSDSDERGLQLRFVVGGLLPRCDVKYVPFGCSNSTMVKAVEAMTIAHEGGRLEIRDIERDAHLLVNDVQKHSVPPGVENFERLVRQVDRIAAAFNVSINFPVEILEEDLMTVDVYFEIVERGVLEFEAAQLDLVYTKTAPLSEENKAMLSSEFPLQLSPVDFSKELPPLFGRPLDLGACSVSTDKAVLEEGHLARYDLAPVGEDVNLTILPRASLTVLFHRFQRPIPRTSDARPSTSSGL